MFTEDADKIKFAALIEQAKNMKKTGRLTTEQLEWFLSLAAHERDLLFSKNKNVIAIIRSFS